MHTEPGSSRDGQPIHVDAPDHVALPRDVSMPSGEFDVGMKGEHLIFKPVPDQPIGENPSVQPL